MGEFISAPDDVQIRSYEEQIVLIDVARSFGGDVEYLERRVQFMKRSFQARSISMRTAEAKQRVSLAKSIMQGYAVALPDVWETRARPRRREISRVVRIGAITGLLPDNR